MIGISNFISKFLDYCLLNLDYFKLTAASSAILPAESALLSCPAAYYCSRISATVCSWGSRPGRDIL
jgi:hypothetical protein